MDAGIKKGGITMMSGRVRGIARIQEGVLELRSDEGFIYRVQIPEKLRSDLDGDQVTHWAQTRGLIDPIDAIAISR